MKSGIDYIGVSVGAMIFNKKGELFLSKRSKNATNECGCWEVPGGKVNFGETLQNAVKREIKEEYGIDIELLEQLPAANHLILKEKQHWVPTTFLARIKKGSKPTILEPKKCDAIGWFNLSHLPKPLSIITRIDLKYFRNKKQRNTNNSSVDELLQTDKEFSQLSVKEGAAYAFSQYLTSDAIMLPQNKLPVFGIKSIYDSINKPNSKDILSWEPIKGEVSNSGDFGYTWGGYLLILSNGEKIKGKYLNVWVKENNGSWKVKVDMGNTNPKS